MPDLETLHGRRVLKEPPKPRSGDIGVIENHFRQVLHLFAVYQLVEAFWNEE